MPHTFAPRGPFGPRYPQGPFYPPGPRHSSSPSDGWRQYTEVTVRMDGLPPGVTTLELYKLLEKKGNITRIDISGSGNAISAFVKFSPAPDMPFWLAQIPMRGVKVRLQLLGPSNPRMNQSNVSRGVRVAEQVALFAESLEFGVMHTESSMMIMKEVLPKPNGPIRVQIDTSRRSLDVIFPLDMLSTEADVWDIETFRFRVSLAHMESVRRTSLGGSRVALVIPMQTPPIFWRKTKEIDDSHETSTSHSRVWNEHAAFYRHTDISDDWLALVNDPVRLNKLEEPQIDMGRWTTYRLIFDLSKPSSQSFSMMSTVLAEYNVNIVNDRPVDVVPRARAQVWDLVDGVTHDEDLLSLGEDPLLSRIKLSFPIRYQLEVCLSQGYLNEYTITREFLEKLAAMDGEDAKALLEKVADTKRRFYDPMEIFRLNYLHGLSKRAIPEYCTYSRSANVTPSTVYYATPTVETSNRVIRENSEWADRFLRVKFSEEKNEGHIYFATDNAKANKQILDRVWRAMDKGICIGDRRYEFLAFGSSQFRENGAYFFASCKEKTADDIRQVMGDFSQIKEIAKYAARLGQCFSTTRALAVSKYAERDCFQLSREEIQAAGLDPAKYPDGRVAKVLVKAEHSEVVKRFIFEDDRRAIYTFTDGVGKISRPLLQIIGEEFGLPNYLDDPPSLVQFRLGGCKGVLAESPDVMKNAVHIRKSQHKFDAISDGLEICQISRFSSTTLNRQIILCLDALGVPSDVFVRKLREMLTGLDLAMTVEAKALELLQHNIDFNQMTLTVAAMILDGFMEARDPFMMSILQLWRTWNVKHLKDKARLFVKDGAYLLGCTDETKTLHGHFFDEEPYEDASREEKLAALPEIFVQVSDLESPGHYKVITGVCFVARNPSLHPGDIRTVRAVDVEALHHLKNVVVFPQTGDRDIPNMCSGGDLDGDEYMVVWDQDLIPQEINYPPMDFEPTSKAPIPEKVTLKQIKVFFIQYMYNDSLGKIAAQHRRWADWTDEGVKSAQCLELAQLHSKAVDYNKSGVPAKITKDLKTRSRPHWDFDPKFRKQNYYHSNKVLGQIYDEVKQESFKPLYDAQFDNRILNAFELDDDILTKAYELKVSYDEAIRRIMTQHGIRSEFEVWSTFVLEHNNEAKEYGFPELIGQLSLALKQRFQAQVHEYAGGKEFKIIAPFIAAMYTVTAREMGAALANSSRPTDGTARNFDPSLPLMSFPWIFQNELGRIATGDSERVPVAIQAPQRAQKKHKFTHGPGAHGNDDLLLDEDVVTQAEFLEMFKKQNHQANETTEEEDLILMPHDDANGKVDEDGDWLIPAKKEKGKSRKESEESTTEKFVPPRYLPGWRRDQQKNASSPDSPNLEVSRKAQAASFWEIPSAEPVFKKAPVMDTTHEPTTAAEKHSPLLSERFNAHKEAPAVDSAKKSPPEGSHLRSSTSSKSTRRSKPPVPSFDEPDEVIWNVPAKEDAGDEGDDEAEAEFKTIPVVSDENATYSRLMRLADMDLEEYED